VVGAGQEIPARFLIVKHIWIPFHDELYLLTRTLNAKVFVARNLD
jgi:hypothetical protein